MAISLATAVKDRALNKAWRESGSNNKIWLSLPAVIGSPEPHGGPAEEVTFSAASGGVISLSHQVVFAVTEGTQVDEIYLGTTGYGVSTYNNLGRITLNPEERVFFSNNGIYAINEITIALVEDNN